MKKIAIILSVLFGMCRISAAGTFYNSPHLSTASGMADMGLAGTFSFYASTLATGTNNPRMILSSTGGIYAAGFLGIEMATVTARSWMKASSLTVSGQIQGATFRGDGSGLFNLSTGGAVNPSAIAADTTSIFDQLTSTGVSLQRLWSSSLSTWTALVSTGVSLSNFQTAINISTTQINASTTTLFTNLNSTGVSISNLWTSAVSTYTSLISTGIALSRLQSAVSLSTTAFTASTTTLALATASLQAVNQALTVSTTTLSLSTATLKARLDAFATANSTVQTRIDQLQVFVSTGQNLIRDIGNSTAAIRSNIAGGVIALYDNSGTFLGNITTLKLGNNIIGSVTGTSAATGTIIAITTTSSSGGSSGVVNIFTIVDNVPATLQQVSTFNLLTSEFTREVNGTSQTWRISNSTHIYTAVQYFAAVNMTSATIAGNLTAGGSGVFGDAVSGLNLTSVNLSTYPYVDLTDGNNVWRITIRSTPGTGKKIFVMKDQTGGYERFQFDLSSGNMMVGGDPIGGLNSFTPTNAKFTVVGGSIANIGANAQIFVQGLIKSASGFVFPDGTIQQSAQLVAGVALKTYVDNLNPVSISSINYPTSEFTWETAGSSGTLGISKSSHSFLATQTFLSSTTMNTLKALNTTIGTPISTMTTRPTLFVGGHDIFSNHVATFGATFILDGDQVANGGQNNSPTLRFMAHGSDISSPNSDIPSWFDFGSRTIATTYNKQNAIFTFSNSSGTPVWATDNLRHFSIFPTAGTTSNYSGPLSSYFDIGGLLIMDPSGYAIFASSISAGGLFSSQPIYVNNFTASPQYSFGGGNTTTGLRLAVVGTRLQLMTNNVERFWVTDNFNQSNSSFNVLDVVTSSGFIAPSATFTATNSGSYSINGKAIFTSSSSVHQLDGYTLYAGSAALSGVVNSTMTIFIPGSTSIFFPQINQYGFSGVQFAGFKVEDWKSSFTVTNTTYGDPTNIRFSWICFVK